MPTYPYVPFTYVGTANEVTTTRLNTSELGIRDMSQQPAVRVFHNTTQALTTSVETALAFNSERFDQAGGSASTQHSTVTNTSRLTCLYAGVYQITATVEFAVNATGLRHIKVLANSVTPIAEQATLVTSASDSCALTITTLYALAVNDWVEVFAFQNSGGNLNVNSTANVSPEFMMVRVG